VTYADDLVILCRKGRADEALQQLRKIMSKLKLTVNEEKTRICRVPEGEFNFLGYSFGRMYSAKTGKAYLGYWLSGAGDLVAKRGASAASVTGPPHLCPAELRRPRASFGRRGFHCATKRS